jgi:hypothetical protein
MSWWCPFPKNEERVKRSQMSAFLVLSLTLKGAKQGLGVVNLRKVTLMP